MVPVIAIVGRPNVGKSTLFNRLTGTRDALVDDRPGVTRDRHYGEATWYDREFVVIDTGGFEPDPSSLPDGDLFLAVRRQAELAIEEADVVLFVVDRQMGVTPADKMTADILRRAMPPKEGKERVLLIVNKCDGDRHDVESWEFSELGVQPMMCVSAEHGRNIYDLWDEIILRIPPPDPDEVVEEEPDNGEIRVAVLGRPNIGKSTLTNRLLGEERHVVHDSPGTTMDAIDSVFEQEGQVWRIVDTAGIRRRARIDDRLESLSTFRAIKAIERCHISLLMIDGEEGVTTQDARLAALIADRGRGCIILVNRWDLVRLDPERGLAVVKEEIERKLPHLSWAPQLYISALTGKGTHRVLPLCKDVFENFDRRVSTARLNEFLTEAVASYQPPQRYHHPVRLNYMTQTRVRPPSFVIWSNTPDGVKDGYKRYLENQLRARYGFIGSPIRIDVRKKRKPGEEKEET